MGGNKPLKMQKTSTRVGQRFLLFVWNKLFTVLCFSVSGDY